MLHNEPLSLPLYKKLDLTYVRRPRWYRSWRFWLAALAVVLTGGWFAVGMAWQDHTPHSPGPVSHVHAGFETSCAQCHSQTPDEPGFLLHVSDHACVRCHSDMAAHPDPHGKLFGGEDADTKSGHAVRQLLRTGCIACHAEHKGRDHSLTLVRDQTCTQCHGDLKSYWPAHGTGDSGTVLVDHIAPAMTRSPVSPRIFLFERDHPDWDLLAPDRVDDTPLRFEHRVHLDPDFDASTSPGSRYSPSVAQRLPAIVESSVLSWLGHPDRETPFPVAQVKSAVAGRSMTVMQCQACHVPDDSGRYMLPVTYEANCKMCHPTPAHGLAVTGYAADRLLELKASLVQTLLPNVKVSDLLSDAGRSAASAAEQGAPKPSYEALERSLKASLAQELLTSPQHAVEMIVKQMKPAAAEEEPPPPCGADDAAVFEANAALLREMRQLTGENGLAALEKCSLCHRPVEATTPLPLPPDEADRATRMAALFNNATSRQAQWLSTDWSALGPSMPDKPRRWLPRSRFSHAAHDTMSCVDCHNALAPARERGPAVRRQHWSGHTQEILMPSISSCIQCHSKKGGVTQSCVTCHDFHAP